MSRRGAARRQLHFFRTNASIEITHRHNACYNTYFTTHVFMYVLVLGLFTRNPGKPERVLDILEYFRAGTRSLYDFRVRASRV